MANIAPLKRDELSEFEPFFEMAEAFMGFVPNSLYTMGRQPEILRAFAGLTGAVFGAGTIEPGLRQMVAYIASTAAGCRYCQAHTAATAKHMGVDPDKIASAWEFETDSRFDERERAALRLARDAALVPNASTPEHFEALRRHFSETEIIELVAVISLFGWLNRWNDTMATDLEDEPKAFASSKLAPTTGWKVGKHGKD